MNNTLLQNKYLLLILALVAFIALVWAFTVYMPDGVDWHEALWPAGRAVLQGKSPYTEYGYRNAPWTAIPLAFFAIFPVKISQAIMTIIGLAAITYTAHQLGAKPLTIVFILVSPLTMHMVLNGNIDWLAALGFIMPPQIGLFFISMKPQMAHIVGLFWLIEAWRAGGWKEALRVFGPFGAVILLSFLLFGFWPSVYGRSLDLWWNASLWPQSIPIGLALTVAAIRKRKIEFAMGASPCLSPYLLLHSWIGALLAISASQIEAILAVIGLWILVIVQAI